MWCITHLCEVPQTQFGDSEATYKDEGGDAKLVGKMQERGALQAYWSILSLVTHAATSTPRTPSRNLPTPCI